MKAIETPIPEKVATFIKQKREALGMNQREFSKHIFGHTKHQGWISMIESGRGISLHSAAKILTALNAGIEIVEY